MRHTSNISDELGLMVNTMTGHVGAYANKPFHMVDVHGGTFYSVIDGKRLELNIGYDKEIVKYYPYDVTHSLETKWKWFFNLPTVIKAVRLYGE
jgi:hypothetical protein